MSARLTDVWIKMERAKQHLDELDVQVDQFFAEQPFRIAQEVDPDGGTLARLIVKKPPPPIFGAIVGDYVHNLRTALDYLAWHLVDSNDGAPGRHTSYPIALSESDFVSQSTAKLRGATPAAVCAVSRAQPFRDPEPQRNGLWVLHELDRYDKHRLMHPVSGALERFGFAPLGEVAIDDMVIGRLDRFVRDGQVLLRGRGSGTIRAHAAFGLVLDREAQPLRQTLMSLYAVTERAITDAAGYVS